MEERPSLWSAVANMLNKQSRKNDKWCSSRLVLGELLTSTQLKNKNYVTNPSMIKPQARTDNEVQRKWDVRFGKLNVRNLYRAGSLLSWIFRNWDVGTWRVLR